MRQSNSGEYDFCVLISYYNNQEGLIRSLKSICYDPVKYNVLIVDDGSREPLSISGIAGKLPPSLNLEIITMPQNSGITKALNTGLHYLEGQQNFRYIARLDCGDVCSEDRFQRQVEFMDQHPDIDLVGSWCIFKDFSTGEAYSYTTPTDHKQILRDMHFKNVFIHPAVMWRAGMTNAQWEYPEDFPHAEDYGFCYEMLHHGKSAILPYYLVTCEISHSGLSLAHRHQQLKSRIKVVRHYGDSALYGFIGEARLRLLMLLPMGLALKIKKRIRRVRHAGNSPEKT